MRWKSEKFPLHHQSPCLSSSSTPHYFRHCHHITHPHCSWRPAGRSRCRSGWCSCCAGSPAAPRGTWRSPHAAWSPPDFQSFPMIELKNQSFNHCHDHSNQQPIIGNIITWELAPQKKTKLKELQATRRHALNISSLFDLYLLTKSLQYLDMKKIRFLMNCSAYFFVEGSNHLLVPGNCLHGPERRWYDRPPVLRSNVLMRKCW